MKNHGLAQLSFRLISPPTDRRTQVCLETLGGGQPESNSLNSWSGGKTHTSHPPTTAPGVQTSATFASTSHMYYHQLQLPPSSADLQVYYYKKKKENVIYDIYIIIYEIYITLYIFYTCNI